MLDTSFQRLTRVLVMWIPNIVFSKRDYTYFICFVYNRYIK